MLKPSRSDWWFVGAVLAVLLLASWWPRMSGQLNADTVRELVSARLQKDAALSNPELVVYAITRTRDETRVASRLLHKASTLVFVRWEGVWTWNGVAADRDPQLSVEQYLDRIRDENEAAAVGTIRALNTAEVALRIRTGRYGTVNTLQTERLLVVDLRSSLPRGYDLDVVLDADASTFRISATPIAYARSGVRSFYSDESLIVRGADHRGDAASARDPECESKDVDRAGA